MKFMLRVPIAIISGFFEAIALGLALSMSVVGLIIPLVTYFVMYYIAEFIVDVFDLTPTFDLSKGVVVLMFVITWMACTLEDLQRFLSKD